LTRASASSLQKVPVVLVVGGGDVGIAELVVFELLTALVLRVPVLIDAAVMNLKGIVGGRGPLDGCCADGGCILSSRGSAI